jgi:D-glycero-alpha-D-manno-heptose-7-phosphate kinase
MIITQTPLRVSLLGGGTDLEEYYKHRPGFVVSCAIDKFVYVIVKERYDDLIYLNYSQKEIVSNVSEIRHDLIREAMRMTDVRGGIELSTLADIPSEGSGLGSSSSILVGLLNALYIYKGKQVTAETLAHQACKIEIEICGRPIGKQDQYIAAFGGVCGISFLKSGAVEIECLDLTDADRRILGSNLLLFFTGITRKSAHILSDQKTNTLTNLESLSQMAELASLGKRAILSRQFNSIGELLHQSWQHKKMLSSKISNPQIDEMYARAISAGASGGKVSGAGGGGFLLLYCKREKQNAVREALREYREMPFLLENDGSKVIFNYRRYSWR